MHQQRVDFAFVKAIRSVPIFDAKKLPSIARLLRLHGSRRMARMSTSLLRRGERGLLGPDTAAGSEKRCRFS